MGAGLDGPEQPGATDIRINGFVQQVGTDAVEQALQLTRRARDDQEQLRCDGLEQGSPSLRGDPMGQALERLANEREEASADHERQDGGVEKGFDDVAIGARHRVDAVVALELFEEELHLPAERVRRADVLRRELLHGNVGDVERVCRSRDPATIGLPRVPAKGPCFRPTCSSIPRRS